MQSILRNMILGMAAVAIAASMSSVSAQEKKAKKVNPSIGSWKLNIEKSKFSPGPAPKSLTVTFEEAGKGVKVTSNGVAADGKTATVEFTASYDGKDNPLKGSPIADTVSLTRIDSRTTMRTDKKGGKVVQTIKRVVQKDGKTFTADVKAKTPKGKPVRNKLLFEKV